MKLLFSLLLILIVVNTVSSQGITKNELIKLVADYEQIHRTSLSQAYKFYQYAFSNCTPKNDPWCQKLENKRNNLSYQLYALDNKEKIELEEEKKRMETAKQEIERVNIFFSTFTHIDTIAHSFTNTFDFEVNNKLTPQMRIKDLLIAVNVPISNELRNNFSLEEIGYKSSISLKGIQCHVSLPHKNSKKKSANVTEYDNNAFIIKEVDNSNYTNTTLVNDLTDKIELKYVFSLDGHASLFSKIPYRLDNIPSRNKYNDPSKQNILVVLSFEIELSHHFTPGSMANSRNNKLLSLSKSLYFSISNKELAEWENRNYCIGESCTSIEVSEK